MADLLSDRGFLRDMARLSEGIVMYDLSDGELPHDSAKLTSREVPAFFAPLKVCGCTEDKRSPEECLVRQHCIRWANSLEGTYDATVVEWIDTAVDMEKPACLVRLSLEAGRTVLVVVFRGSRTTSDWTRTNANLNFRTLPACESPEGAASSRTARSRYMPFLARSRRPCVAAGMWLAYAGRCRRCAADLGPRARVRAALERQLTEACADGSAAKEGRTVDIVLTGHSMGGNLAILAASDLLQTSSIIARTGVCCLAFASTRSFNAAFRRQLAAFKDSGSLRAALRVVVEGDFVPNVPHCLLGFGGVHGLEARLLLSPNNLAQPIVLEPNADPTDADCRRMPYWPRRASPAAHTIYSALLAGETPKGQSRTVTWEVGSLPLPKPRAPLTSQNTEHHRTKRSRRRAWRAPQTVEMESRRESAASSTTASAVEVSSIIIKER
jgi:pimeloyl-ACP methyl ester carboxylesterase